MKYLTLVLLFISQISCNSQGNKLKQHQLIKEQSNEIFNDLVQIRRDLHQYPELSGYEKRTSKIVEKYLLDLGLEVKKDIGGYGLVGILNDGKEGKKIAWRADMDAIKIINTDRVDFKSQNNGIAHMCGHDIHTTIGLGIANVLSNLKEDIQGTVYFIFQPSEETFKGANAMVEEGLFDMIKPDEIYATHIIPTKRGIISSGQGEVFAYEKTLKIKFKPNVDENELKQSILSMMQNLARNKPNSEPWDLQYITDSDIGLENEETIYKDFLIILPEIHVIKEQKIVAFEATFFETNRNNLDSIPAKIRENIIESKYKGSFIEMEYSRGNPTVINDSILTNTGLETIRRIYGDESTKLVYGQVPYFNEDFIYFQKVIPGVLFFLGGSNFEKGLTAMPHSPDFAVDEETIKLGVQRFSSLLLERINNE